MGTVHLAFERLIKIFNIYDILLSNNIIVIIMNVNTIMYIDVVVYCSHVHVCINYLPECICSY